MRISMVPAYNDPQTTRKSNAIIAASYRLSPNEQRVIYSVLMQLKDNETPTDQRFYFVTGDDIVLDGVGETSKFNALKRVCSNLYLRTISIEGVPNGASKTGIVPLLETRWIQSKATYFEGEGRIGLRLSHDILPFISQLRRDFTRLPSRPMFAMTSSYAQRVFEMLMQFRDTGVFKISVADFRHRLDLDDEYKKFSDLKRRVVEVAVGQINEHARIGVKVEYKKKGKAVKDLVFTFRKDSDRALKLATPAENKETDDLELNGFTLDEVKAFCKKMGRDDNSQSDLNLSARQLAKLKG